ncbi:MAG: MFS transporter [Pseudomonadota bacterium]|uniref:MFS transporter n=1 Tax=Novosphingobium sp. MBES04 TaxID=1206458 RepID=UPI00057CAE9A|nr:MFS transporter [Novosphingobium sp. MBES04]MED5546790.1 MFS transporter [Pseudomonadota bacterium]GAM05260.1 benzoate transport protein [Novosphingobium sp. MBES04]
MQGIDVGRLIEQAPLSSLHKKIIVACAILLVVDGYDVFIYGAVLPRLMDEWGLSPTEAGSLASWALFGMMGGALVFGPLGDRIGRKTCITLCFTLFSASTFLNGFVTTPLTFGLLRFAAGLGCGGLMPNAVALTNEYAPKRIRSTLVALMFSGYAVGGMVAAGLAIYLLPAFGWPSMFFAAAVPLICLPLILKALPESIGFLIRKGEIETARAHLRQLAPEANLPADAPLEYHEAKVASTSVGELFRQGRALGTFAMWLSFFCCLLMVYGLSSWLPKLMVSAGYSLGSSLSFLLALSFGGMFGAISGGRLADRFGLPRVVMAYFALGSACLMLLGLNSPMPVLYLLIFIAGAGTTGTQILLYACVAEFYTLSVRSTGLGWASGMGRVGAIVGPMLGGILLSAQLPMGWNFVAFAVPGFISVAATALFTLSLRRQAAATVAATTASPAPNTPERALTA